MITMFTWDKQTKMRCAISTSCTGWRARTLWTSGSVFHPALHSGLGKEALCFLTSQMRLLPPYHKPRQLDYQTRICPLFKQTKIHIHLCLLFKQTNKKRYHRNLALYRDQGTETYQRISYIISPWHSYFKTDLVELEMIVEMFFV